MRTTLTAMSATVRRFLSDQSAATAIEYGLIASLIGVAIILGATALGTNLNATFQGIAGKMVTPS